MTAMTHGRQLHLAFTVCVFSGSSLGLKGGVGGLAGTGGVAAAVTSKAAASAGAGG